MIFSNQNFILFHIVTEIFSPRPHLRHFFVLSQSFWRNLCLERGPRLRIFGKDVKQYEIWSLKINPT